VVIDDRLVLTVALLAEDYVELSLIDVNGSYLGSFVAHVDESVALADDVQVVVIRFEGEKVRLGIEGPPDSSFHRGEFWNRPR